MATSKQIIPSIYRHTQETPSDSWVITHNLGANGSQGIPIVDCVINNGGVQEKIIPSVIEWTTKNITTLYFSVPRVGSATIIV